MAKMKSKSVSFKVTAQKYIIAAGLLMVAGVLCSVTAISQAIGKATGLDGSMIQAYGNNALAIGLSVMLLVVGSVTSAVPLVGTLLMIAGVVVLLFEAVKIYNQYFSKGNNIEL